MRAHTALVYGTSEETLVGSVMADGCARFGKVVFGLGLALATSVPLSSALAYQVIYTFHGASDGSDSFSPLIKDSAGNLYGTTSGGGANNAGTIFELTPGGTEITLHAFTGSDGKWPLNGLVMDKSENLFGMTWKGGSSGDGTIFELAANGTETVLHNFSNGADGGFPFDGVIEDSAGNLYGTASSANGNNSSGVVFKYAAGGTYSVLYTFTDGADGGEPSGDLLRDSSGNLYGTTFAGGINNCPGYTGCGVVFKLDTSGNETVLYTFGGGSDGGNPAAGLMADGAGNLYGTTQYGGTGCSQNPGCGTVFKIAANGTYSVLYKFTGGNDGATPHGSLIRDRKGNLYGTAEAGGPSQCGVVFKLTPGGTETVLHAFACGSDGAEPLAALLRVGKQLLGTTGRGGDANNDGVVFKLAK